MSRGSVVKQLAAGGHPGHIGKRGISEAKTKAGKDRGRGKAEFLTIANFVASAFYGKAIIPVGTDNGSVLRRNKGTLRQGEVFSAGPRMIGVKAVIHIEEAVPSPRQERRSRLIIF